MSNLVFPKLAGQAWPIEREARWTTEVRETPSGREFRAGSMSTPRWMYRLRFDVLRQGADGELAQLMGFFNLHRGALDSFLFEDEDDKSVSAQQFAQADGTTKDFQLVRSFGGFSEPVYELNGAPVITVNGAVVSTGWTVDKGRISFTTAPAAASILRWSGAYYWRVRFADDRLRASQFLQHLWDCRQLELITVKP